MINPLLYLLKVLDDTIIDQILFSDHQSTYIITNKVEKLSDIVR